MTAREPIEIACQSNARFAPDCAVMLRSLLVENPQESFVVHFVHDELLPSTDLARLGEIVAGLGSVWAPHRIDPELAAGFPVMDRYGGVTAWFRLLLPRLLGEVPRVLYLDADLLVLAPIRPLWETDLAGRSLAAATNPLIGRDRRRVITDLGLPDPGSYFNSGVMLLDLARLRDTGLMLEAERIARTGLVPTPWADQEPLNVALWKERVALHPRWNVMNPLFDLPPRQLPWPRHEVREAVRSPAIIHFIGPYKPWHYRLRHRYADRYFDHLAQTPFRGRPQEGRSRRHALLRPLAPRVAMRYEMVEYALRVAAAAQASRAVRLGQGAAARNPHLYARARAAYRLARPGSAPAPLLDILDAVADSISEVCFIQIGSNDADHNDPLRPYVERFDWRGILVEPVPYVFDRLRIRYGENPRIELVNAAVAAEDGPLPFYYVAESDDPGLPEWYDQIGSFSRENVLHPFHVEQIPDLAGRVVEAEVPALTFATLSRTHPLPGLDVVHIDAEGFDDAILRQIDLTVLRPLILLYEQQHLGEVRRRELGDRLSAAGYGLLDLGPDALAVRSDAPLLVRLAVRRQRGRLSTAPR